MESFLQTISHYPTVVYTIMILILIGYWFLVTLGLFDFDLFDIDIDIEAEGADISGAATFLVSCGLTGVPLMIVLTIIIFVSWIISFSLMHYLLNWMSSGFIKEWVLGTGVLIGSFAFSLPITAQIIKPLRKVFRKLYADSGQKSFIGRECKIRSLKVNSETGEAECIIDGASLIVKVRTKHTNQSFSKGDIVVIHDYDASTNIYLIQEKNILD